MCKLVVRVLKWIQLWFMVLSWQCWVEVFWRKPNIRSNPDNSSNKNLNSVKNITYILYRLTWLQSIPPYCIVTVCERCMWHFQPAPLNRETQREMKDWEAKEISRAHFQWAIILRVGLFLSLFSAANQFLTLHPSVCEEKCTETTSTAVQFIFTNAGVAQTQNRGQLNTAPN